MVRPSSSHTLPHTPSRHLHTTASLPQLYSPSLHHRRTEPHMNSPGPSPSDIQNHLYHAFLEGRTADVVLRVRGSWQALYKLHRVVLIQSGFFQTLFTGSFHESQHKFRASGHKLLPDEVELVFDDPNITRPAFEICIARLYGGGPPLHISPSLLPSPSCPLTSSFPCPPHTSSPIPPNHHSATPPFLLSLLATAVYLSIPSVASQALSLILNSVGPYTVMRYLGFAVGKGIGLEEGEDDLRDAAVGLEGVAEIIKEEDEDGDQVMSLPDSPPPAHKEEDKTPTAALEDVSKKLGFMEVKKEDPMDGSVSSSSSSEDLSAQMDSEASEPSYYYGAVSAKVGEACACWLARWGRDMFEYEEKVEKVVAEGKVSPPANFLSGTGPSRRRATTISTTPESLHFTFRAGEFHANAADVVVPLIWRRGGLDASWVKALVMSDFLFVNAERERFELAKGVVEMRRRQGLDGREEVEWEEMFSTGIYYANMTFDDLMSISKDVSPTTGRPYVSLHVLQSASWTQSVLRHRINSGPFGTASPPSTPGSGQRDKELGVTLTAAEIRHSLSNAEAQGKSYYPIPADSSVRIGDTSALENASMDELFASPTSEPVDPKKVSRLSTSESTFFGLLSSSSQHRAASACSAPDARWSTYPPFRFGVEFWDVDELKEKSRLHSQTIWYAGSLFNVYVQVVRKKGVPGVQLGVYLHRQSSVDPVPPRSAPSTLTLGSRVVERERERGAGHDRRISAPNASTAVHPSASLPSIGSPLSRSTTPVSTSASLPGSPGTSLVTAGGSSNTIPATSPPVMPPQPYRDPRSAILAYFTISCASATGASLTQFTSAPDTFSVSQSWGWKSSSLRTEEYLEVGGEQGQRRSLGKEVSLRATVVLGVV
ncbi:hypothetical protein OE88DRAFT_1804172 [Heliocybe sulcata]|uniref:BTB domain-containing protein n=1 Tax=Heliocybe sulcata TaxID=5364 RepID=A0A5C3NLB0_9AGAM|nr:hypothetical protein OE88DRAFT_1804172 [Heliocybe sulcata]